MSIVVTILCFLVMLVGLAGAVLPVLPGLPIIWVAFLGYGLYDGWQDYGWQTMLAAGLVAALSLAVDQLASVYGAKKFGAGRAGMIGSFVGALLGVIFLNIPGLILGTFFGALICEMAFDRRDLKAASASGLGALLGFLAGSLFKFMMSAALIAYFLYAVIF
ncbi:MAG: DUF456 domain-containing protein [Candidatus Adiutrix sp.]|jgi:uncharacterized protein YqgC (DUF456 family)|nr:DUF456 domain-containing protein [Candidatus Adiutrix sp.]